LTSKRQKALFLAKLTLKQPKVAEFDLKTPKSPFLS